MTQPVRTRHLADHINDRPRARIDLGAMLADPGRRSKLAEAFCLPDREPRTTTVDPELSAAMLDLRHWIERAERIRYASRFARRYGRDRAVTRLDLLATTAQCQIESALERVESLVCAGRGNK